MVYPKCEACEKEPQGNCGNLSRKNLDENSWLRVGEACFALPMKAYRKMLFKRVKEAKAKGKDLTEMLGGKGAKENDWKKID